MSNKVRKTEHAGAKNRGGSWGHREEVKRESRKVRRVADRRAISEGLRPEAEKKGRR